MSSRSDRSDRSDPAGSGRWHDAAFIRVWDAQPQNPLKLEQLDILTAVIKDDWRRGARILDLGSGTGRVEEFVYRRLPVARFTCVDRSEAMAEQARKRLARHGDRCRFVMHDLARLDRLRLADAPFRFIISVDAVHELRPRAQARLFRFCRRSLARDGALLILDRVAIDNRRLRLPYASVLARLQRITGARTGQFSDCFTDPRHRDREHPLSVEQYLRRLRRARFAPALLHLHFHKALFAARPV